MKMNMKFSLILVAAMFSLLIIGFGGAAPAQAAGNCAETLLLNVSASESTAFTDCRALQADAARYTGLAASYTNETNNVQRTVEADAARYTGLALFYTAAAAGTCLGIGTTEMMAAEFVNCRLDSAYQAANPELMVSHRFVVADRSATAVPVSVDIEDLVGNMFLDNIEEFRATQTDPAYNTVEPVDIEVLRNNYYNSLRVAQTDPAAEPVDLEFLQHNPDYYRGR
jgi:hypothetical protein